MDTNPKPIKQSAGTCVRIRGGLSVSASPRTPHKAAVSNAASLSTGDLTPVTLFPLFSRVGQYLET